MKPQMIVVINKRMPMTYAYNQFDIKTIYKMITAATFY